MTPDDRRGRVGLKGLKKKSIVAKDRFLRCKQDGMVFRGARDGR